MMSLMMRLLMEAEIECHVQELGHLQHTAVTTDVVICYALDLPLSNEKNDALVTVQKLQRFTTDSGTPWNTLGHSAILWDTLEYSVYSLNHSGLICSIMCNSVSMFSILNNF